MQPTLINQTTHEAISLEQRTLTFGRKSDNDVVLRTDSKISRYHAKIIWHHGNFVVEDLGSSNGCFINEQPLQQATVLNHNDLLRLGNTEFLVLLPPPDFDERGTVVVTEPLEEVRKNINSAEPQTVSPRQVTATQIEIQPETATFPPRKPPASPQTHTPLIVGGIIGFIILLTTGIGLTCALWLSN